MFCYVHWYETIDISLFARNLLFLLHVFTVIPKYSVSLISPGDVFWQGWYCLAKVLHLFPGALGEREGTSWEAPGISEHERRSDFATDYRCKYCMSCTCLEAKGFTLKPLSISLAHFFVKNVYASVIFCCCRNQLERIGEVVWMQCPFPWTTRSPWTHVYLMCTAELAPTLTLM